MAGTADPVDVWLLLEYKRSWAAKVNRDNTLDEEVKHWWTALPDFFSGLGLKARQQFIRQTDIESEGVRLIVSLSSGIASEYAASGQSYEFVANNHSEFLQIDWKHFLKDPNCSAERAAPPFSLLKEPCYFVCTNGRRDICCARLGLQTYIQLRKSVDTRVWQISHLGGHRFAPNVLVLPKPVLYGRVTSETVPEFVSHVEEGGVDLVRMRGCSNYEQIAQAAEIFLLRTLEQTAPRPVLREINAMKNTGFRQAVFECLFSHSSDQEIRVSLCRSQHPNQILASCKDELKKAQHPFQLLSIN